MRVFQHVLRFSSVILLLGASIAPAPAPPRWQIEVLPALSVPNGQLIHIWARDINERGQVAGTAEGSLASAVFRYTPGVGMEDLDPDGQYRSRAFIGSSINNRGHVLGRTYDRVWRQKDVFLHRGPRRGLDDLGKGKTPTVAAGFETFGGQTFIPEDGHFCGSVRIVGQDGTVSRRPYLYTRRGGWADLTRLHPRFQLESAVYCKYTNQRGDLVLAIAGASGTQEAFVRIGRERVVEIPSFELAMNTTAEPNGSGTVAGIYRTPEGDDPVYNLRAYVWTPEAGLTPLHPEGVMESQALFVTERSEVWGILSTDGIAPGPDGRLVGLSDKVFRYRQASGLRVVLDRADFEALARRHGRELRDMWLTGANNRGAVVGQVAIEPFGALPFYYSKRSGLVDLASVVDQLAVDFVLDETRLADVVDVNDKGDILLVGAGRDLGPVRSAILRFRRE